MARGERPRCPWRVISCLSAARCSRCCSRSMPIVPPQAAWRAMPPPRSTGPPSEFVPTRNCRSGWSTTPAFRPLFRRPRRSRWLPPAAPRFPKVRRKARVRDTFAQFVPVEAEGEPEPQVQRKRKIAKSPRRSSADAVAQQSALPASSVARAGTAPGKACVALSLSVSAASESCRQTRCSRSAARLPLSGTGNH